MSGALTGGILAARNGKKTCKTNLLWTDYKYRRFSIQLPFLKLHTYIEWLGTASFYQLFELDVLIRLVDSLA